MNRPPNHRRAVITGLRELADLLSTHPDIPVPLVVEIGYHPRGESDTERRAEVDRIAKRLGVAPRYAADRQHYLAIRRFGGGTVHYRAVMISNEERARWDALMTYTRNITPDDTPGADR